MSLLIENAEPLQRAAENVVSAANALAHGVAQNRAMLQQMIDANAPPTSEQVDAALNAATRRIQAVEQALNVVYNVRDAIERVTLTPDETSVQIWLPPEPE